MLWIKFGENSSKNKSNTYIACLYNSWETSTYTKINECYVIELIEKQLGTFPELDKIVIGGDFNCRIGTKEDFINEDRKDLDFLAEYFELDSFTTPRNKKMSL